MSESEPKKTAFFIDGFNVYHFLKRHGAGHLWLDYFELCKTLAPVDEVVAVNYYSAEAFWVHGKVIKHRAYIRVLEDSGVDVHMGDFADKDKIGHMASSTGTRNVTFFGRTFPAHKRKFYTHEEKQTDVAIGVGMYRAASRDGVKKIALISNDTDFRPALQIIRNDFPEIKLKVYAPVRTGIRLPNVIKDVVKPKNHKHLPIGAVLSSQFPDLVTLNDGTQISKPTTW